MTSPMPRSLFVAMLLAGVPAAAAPAPIRVVVDASEAPRHILHTHLGVPVNPGPLTLVYPQWIPGEHGPTGPIASVVGLRMAARRHPLLWRRDAEDPFAFHVEVPAGTSELDVSFDIVPGGVGVRHSADASTSAQLAVVSWNQLVLYPKGARARDVLVVPAVVLPPGWHLGTALATGRQAGVRTEFGPVTLETLVDSPVLAGQSLRTVDLSPGASPAHLLHVAGDSAAAVAVPDELLGRYRKLVAEAAALFGAQHYRRYQFLLALSDQVAHFGLEHHESSDNRQRERVFLEEPLRVVGAGLLPHEFVHSWNGKYRRPAGLATPDFQQPMHTELLWVYEGLTTYLGNVLTARSGLRTVEETRDALALTAATLDASPGRTWRSLADTAVAAQILYGTPREWRSWRRGVDFYPESELIWLEADAVIRQASGGRRTLDDFCRAFHGGASGPPSVVPYTFEDLTAALGAIAGHDWRGFFAARIDVPTARAPLGGLDAAGWRLVYRETPTRFFKLAEQADKIVDLSFSVGLVLRDDGVVLDALPGAPAALAGIAPSMKVVAVNGRRFTADRVREAVRDTRGRPDLDLLTENGDVFRTHRLAYRGGARYPALERVPGRPDLLEAIYRPAAPR
jgi:predicted metalloprotease with PDZ domain